MFYLTVFYLRRPSGLDGRNRKFRQAWPQAEVTWGENEATEWFSAQHKNGSKANKRVTAHIFYSAVYFCDFFFT